MKRSGARPAFSRETVARLDELAAIHSLDPPAVASLRALLELQSSDLAASTAVRDPGAAVDRHLADSLTGLELEEVHCARRIADLGAGAGWPGFALAAALPEAEVALVESATRHCRYLASHCCRRYSAPSFAN